MQILPQPLGVGSDARRSELLHQRKATTRRSKEAMRPIATPVNDSRFANDLRWRSL